MALVSQNCRDYPPNQMNLNNPNGLSLDIKGAFRILVDTGPPSTTTGTFFDYYIDEDTGNFYEKGNDGIWTLIYNFTTTPGTGVTTLANLGAGAFIFVPPVVGGVANLRSLTSSTGKITLTTNPNDISLGVNLNKTDVGLSLVQNILNNYNASVAPTGADDSSMGYSVGSSWWDSTHDAYWICQSPALGFAIWIPINPAPTGLTNIDNIGTGTAQVFSSITGSTAHLRSIGSADGSVAVTQAGNNINLQVTPGLTGVANAGSTTGHVFINTTAGTANLRGVGNSDGYITVNDVGNDIIVNLTNPPVVTPTFKDVANYSFSANTTTGFIGGTSNTPFQALWTLTGGLNPRPNSVSNWTVGGTPPFTSIARQSASNSISGTNYYLLDWTMTYVTTARPTVAAWPVTVRWSTAFGNITIAPGSVTFFTFPYDPTGTVITSNFEGTLSSSVMIYSNDNMPWSVYQVADLPLASTNQNITITYMNATIRQL